MPAFRKNVEATIPALRRYARALTRDADIADDLVQDSAEVCAGVAGGGVVVAGGRVGLREKSECDG